MRRLCALVLMTGVAVPATAFAQVDDYTFHEPGATAARRD